MSRAITIGPRSVAPARETYAVLLAREELAAEEDRLRGVVNGLAVRIAHNQYRIQDLANSEGPFPEGELAELTSDGERLATLERQARNELFLHRLRIMAQRLDPQPELDELLEHWTEADYEAALEALDARPTDRTPTGPQGS